MTNYGPPQRLAWIGITQQQLADRCGVALRTISYGFRNSVGRWIDLLDALEMMTPIQRQRWLLRDPPTASDISQSDP